MKISYTQEAINDLERLRNFIESKNPFAARQISSELLDGIGNLHSFPKMGLPVARAPDPKAIRDLFIKAFKYVPAYGLHRTRASRAPLN